MKTIAVLATLSGAVMGTTLALCGITVDRPAYWVIQFSALAWAATALIAGFKLGRGEWSVGSNNPRRR